MHITSGDLNDPRVIDMLRYHLTTSRAQTAPGSAHALDLAGLQSPDITFWTAWDGETLVAVGALKQLSAGHGEVKSMHTALAVRRKGVGSAMLQHIIAFARSRGISRLSLETGSWDYFQPAVALYQSHGFIECQPFADYVKRPQQHLHDTRSAQLKRIPLELIHHPATNSVCSPPPCGEGLGVGVGVDLAQNILKYPVNIRQHIVIPISQDLITVRRKGLRAFLIGS